MRYLAVIAAALVFSTHAEAQSRRIADWTVDITATYAEAFTGNASGSTFGLYCFGADDCLFYVDTRTTCNEGAETPLLVNASSGSTYVIGTCRIVRLSSQTRYLNTIRDADMVTAISSGRVIGFAIPLLSGDFRVIRFSLDGAVGASNAVSRALDRIKPRTAPLRDSVL